LSEHWPAFLYTTLSQARAIRLAEFHRSTVRAQALKAFALIQIPNKKAAPKDGFPIDCNPV
jgi:hypothetical protein